MTTISLIIAAIAIAVWTGAIVLQSAVVAPSVFRTLDEQLAGAFLRALFPPFFRVGMTCGAVATIALVPAAALTGWPRPLLVIVAGGILVWLLAALSLKLVPAINAARDAGEAREQRFRRLHGVSVVLTVLGLLIGLTTLGVIASLATASLET